MDHAFALANPISKILGKPREEFTRADLLKVLEAQQLQRITFHYTALDGKLKELKIPVSNRAEAERVLSFGERVDGSSLFKGLVDMALSDLYVVPVYKTAFLNPFDDASLDVVCRYMTPDGSLAPFAPDNVLANAYELLRKTSHLQLHAAGELEFFLLSNSDRRIFPSARQQGYHSAPPFQKVGHILDEMLFHIARITGSVKYGHAEVGFIDSVRSDMEELEGKRAEQLEIEFLPTPIDEMGDHLALARWIIRNVAYRNDLVATFTPKLEEGIAGNGFHVHMELKDGDSNVMCTSEGSLTEKARKAVGGLCTYADSLTAFGNTVSSAYLRLVPHQEAPTRICWSDLNRSALIRVPLGWSKVVDMARSLNPQETEAPPAAGCRQTVELRSPDGSAIVHLLLAGMTMAVEWGLSNPDALEIASQTYVTGNIFQDEKVLTRLGKLPKSCVESARTLILKRRLYERDRIFPPSLIDYVAKILNAEGDENMNHRLADLPADDRLHETRKIMHKDLHKH